MKNWSLNVEMPSGLCIQGRMNELPKIYFISRHKEKKNNNYNAYNNDNSNYNNFNNNNIYDNNDKDIDDNLKKYQ